MNKTERKKFICHICEAGCGVTAEVVDGKVLSVRSNKEDLFSHGYICPKGVSLKELHDDPDRLRTPMVRENGELREASWAEAWDRINEKLPQLRETHGSDSVALYVGNPVAHALGLGLGSAVLRRASGTKNFYSAGSVDQLPRQLACGQLYGDWFSMPVPDIDRTDYLLILGANPIVSNGSLWMVPDFRGRARKMRSRGGKLVVVDPRRSETAQVADRHHFIRPGTDAFFLIGILKILLEADPTGPHHLEKHVNGWDEVKAMVARFSLAEVSTACGIDQSHIQVIARELETTERAAVYGRCGTTMQQFGTLTSWLIEVVNIVAGNLDMVGGAMFATPAAFANNTKGEAGRGAGIRTARFRSRVRGLPEVAGELPLATLADEILTPGEGQVRALIVLAGNPAVSGPDSARLSTALGKLDFMIAIDIYRNETTQHADVILPSVSHFERPHYDFLLGAVVSRNVARFAAPVFEKSPSDPSDWQIMLQLSAIFAGLGVLTDEGLQSFEDQVVAGAMALLLAPGAPLEGSSETQIISTLDGLCGEEKLLDLELRTGPFGEGFGRRPDGISLEKIKAAPDGIDFGPLVPRLPQALRTPSGKIELWSDDIAQEVEKLLGVTGQDHSGFYLIGRRQVRSNNSWLHNLPVLAKGPFRCTAQINPEDAGRLGLADGGKVTIRSRTGEVVACVEISDAVMPGVVSLPHGWGHDDPNIRQSVASLRPGVNANLLADSDLLDGPTGTAVLNGIRVELFSAH